MDGPEATLSDLREAILLACQPQNTSRILAGRQQVLEMPRPWVLLHIEGVAAESVDLSDSWEYRRLLELAQLLDVDLLRRVVALGITRSDRDLREAAEDFAVQ